MDIIIGQEAGEPRCDHFIVLCVSTDAAMGVVVNGRQMLDAEFDVTNNWAHPFHHPNPQYSEPPVIAERKSIGCHSRANTIDGIVSRQPPK